MTGYWQNLADELASDGAGDQFWIIFAALIVMAGYILSAANV
jgi:hypothetical protein